MVCWTSGSSVISFPSFFLTSVLSVGVPFIVRSWPRLSINAAITAAFGRPLFHSLNFLASVYVGIVYRPGSSLRRHVAHERLGVHAWQPYNASSRAVLLSLRRDIHLVRLHAAGDALHCRNWIIRRSRK